MRRFISLAVLVVLCGTCFGQENFALSELQFQGAFGARPGDKTLYCLLGNGFLLTIRSDDEAAIVSDWRTHHPDARAVPVAIMGEHSKMRIVYIWAIDGNDNLNLLLVRKGVVPASVMLDPVQFDQVSRRSAPAHADETLPRRLVSEADYQAFLKELIASENAAQAQKSGIWSDKFKDLREEENTTPLNALPPAILGMEGK